MFYFFIPSYMRFKTIKFLICNIDVRHAALSELSNGKRESINFRHIERITEALQLSDIREIIDLVDENPNERPNRSGRKKETS